MRQPLDFLARFHRDERGVFAVVFAILAIVLVVTAGAVVDFTTVEQYRTRAQDALDSAALGLQPTIWDTGVTTTTIAPEAEAILQERLSDDGIDANIVDVQINTVDGMLRLEATVEVPTAFVALVGVPSLTSRLVSEATRKRLNIEVAMVLDNSGSMNSSNRMTNLKAAANCAVGILMNSDCASTATAAAVDSIKIGIVPFTEFVNVGTGYRNATWMDQTGASSIANDNFDDDDDDSTPFTGNVDRFALYDQLSNVTWRGCVESRPYPYDTNDTAPDPSVPDTLFVPQFAPDTPSGHTNSYLSDSPAACNRTVLLGTCKWTRTRTGCNSAGNSCSGSWSNSYELTAPNGMVTTGSSVCSCTGETTTGPNTSITLVSGKNYRKTEVYSCQDFQTVTPTGLSNRELQERLCKYTGSISTSSGRGPNWDCPTNALLPLTNKKPDITAAITAMYPQGYTNIHQGTIWGFHMLTSGAPLTEARPVTSATYKVMIVMTDGENTVDGYSASDMNSAAGYMAYGYPGTTYNGRIFSSAFPAPANEAEVLAAMNARTVETCNNAKAAGITIYTVGLNAPNETTKDMLKACASTNDLAYFPTQSSQLVTVFREIAAQLSDLRLAK